MRRAGLAVAVLLASAAGSLASAGAPLCTASMAAARICHLEVAAGLAEEEAVLTVEAVVPGEADGSRPDERSGSRQPVAEPRVPVAEDRPAEGGDSGIHPDLVVVRDGYTVTGAPTVRLSDLVRFRPAAGIARMEPAGWGLVGLESNFYAIAPVQQQRGELLGRPASVRFVPVRYHWDYGDGQRRSLPVPGSAWAVLGSTEFSRTPTSHLYAQPGSFTVVLRVEYRAEYRFSGPSWRSIPGTLTVPAAPLPIVVGQAKTLLVSGSCTVGGGSAGCPASPGDAGAGRGER